MRDKQQAKVEQVWGNELADLNLGDGLLQFASNKQRLFGAEIKQVWGKVRINIQTANLILVWVQNNHSKRQKGEGELWLWRIETDGRTITVKSRKERVSYGYGGLKLIAEWNASHHVEFVLKIHKPKIQMEIF